MHRRFAAVAFASAIDTGLLAVRSGSSSPSPVANVAPAGSAGGSVAPATSAPAAPLTITLGHNYGSETDAPVTNTSVKAYSALHPNVTINVDSRPAENGDRQLTRPHSRPAESLP